MHYLKENEWYVKDNTIGWNEDDGDKIVNETHKNIQKYCMQSVCSGENSIDTVETDTNIHMSDNVISLINFGTSDLKEAEKQELKKKLSGFCILK